MFFFCLKILCFCLQSQTDRARCYKTAWKQKQTTNEKNDQPKKRSKNYYFFVCRVRRFACFAQIHHFSPGVKTNGSTLNSNVNTRELEIRKYLFSIFFIFSHFWTLIVECTKRIALIFAVVASVSLRNVLNNWSVIIRGRRTWN